MTAILLRLGAFLVLSFLFYRLIRKIQGLLIGSGAYSSHRHSSGDSRQTTLDPYSLLGVSPQASPSEIKKAYHQKMAEYHPDQVANMGEEIQRVAKEKTQQMNWAYEQLSKKR